MIEEMRKIRHSPYWVWNRFVSVEELPQAKHDLKEAHVRYKVVPIRNKLGKVEKYSVYVM